jgi:hypothetical protein
MRAQDFLIEYSEYKIIPNVFPDGNLKLTVHFDRDRRVERNIDMERILDMCTRAAVQWPEKLNEVSADESFVISDWDDFRVAILKRDGNAGKYDYIVKTARQDLRIGANQQVFRLR